ncbi:MAG: rod shape-determining protein MreD [Actinomycetota bacterium]|nr:rod shape-determining protein MreD [Actinomycetota bacterium]
MYRILAGPAPRLLVIGLFALAIQRAVFAEHPLHDVKLQFVLALVVAAGAGGGSDRGAVAGFVLGLMYDLGGNTPLGQTALAYGMGGIVAGYLHSFTPDPQWWLAAVFAVFGAAVGELSVPLADLVTGESGWITGDLLVNVPVVAVAAGVMCPALLPIGRWMMGVKRKKWKAMNE